MPYTDIYSKNNSELMSTNFYFSIDNIIVKTHSGSIKFTLSTAVTYLMGQSFGSNS